MTWHAVPGDPPQPVRRTPGHHQPAQGGRLFAGECSCGPTAPGWPDWPTTLRRFRLTSCRGPRRSGRNSTSRRPSWPWSGRPSTWPAHDSGGLFIYQFECIARNRLGYDRGMKAISDDPFFDKTWRDWILRARLRFGDDRFRPAHLLPLGAVSGRAAETTPRLQAVVSHSVQRAGGADRQGQPREGSALYVRGVAAADRASRRSPPPGERDGPIIHPALESGCSESRRGLSFSIREVKGEFNLSDFYVKPETFSGPEEQPAGSIT